jgi:hypothetical protein
MIMRMMTGAILILAHAILYGVYQLTTHNNGDLDWIQWYSWCLAGLGAAFVIWGFIWDIEISIERSRRRHAKAQRRAAREETDRNDD